MPAFHHGGTVGWRSAAPGLRQGLRRRARSVLPRGPRDEGRSRGLPLFPRSLLGAGGRGRRGRARERAALPTQGAVGSARSWRPAGPAAGGGGERSGAEPAEAGLEGEGGGMPARLWREAAGCGGAAGGRRVGRGRGGRGEPGCGAIEGRNGTPGYGAGGRAWGMGQEEGCTGGLPHGARGEPRGGVWGGRVVRGGRCWRDSPAAGGECWEGGGPAGRAGVSRPCFSEAPPPPAVSPRMGLMPASSPGSLFPPPVPAALPNAQILRLSLPLSLFPSSGSSVSLGRGY